VTSRADEDNQGVDTEATATTIASEGRAVRDRIRSLLVDSVRERKLSLDEVGGAVRQVVDGAVNGVRDSVPDKQASVLGEVVDGLGEGLSAAANATRLALEEARGRGESFAQEDVDKAVEDLKALEDLFTKTVSDLARRAGSELSGQAKDLGAHAKRTAEHLRPAVESAVKEAARHPVQMARDSATAGLKAAPKAAGMLLQAAAGMLEGAADLLTGESKKKDE
jgi:hypothetical protein